MSMSMRRALHLSFLVAAAAVSVAAQTKIKYGSEYKCGNERVIVYYCRNDSGQPVHESDNYCSVEYPDRPRSNPQFPVAGSVLRSDLLKQFTSCTAAPSSDASVAKAQASKVDTIVFGIQLGDPFSVPVCPMFQIGGAGLKTCYSTLVDQVADLSRPIGSNNTDTATVKTVYLGVNECPSWVNECTLVVTLYDGKVGAVGVFTKGPSVDKTVRAVLAEKYGKWKYSQSATVTPEAAGKEKIPVLTSYWELPGLYIQYQPIWSDADDHTPDIREGIIRVETETAKKARAAAAAKAPKPKM